MKKYLLAGAVCCIALLIGMYYKDLNKSLFQNHFSQVVSKSYSGDLPQFKNQTTVHQSTDKQSPEFNIQIFPVPKNVKMSVVTLAENPLTIAEASKSFRFYESRLIVNGGYFNPDYSPSGFLFADGARVGGAMFDSDKSGLFYINNQGAGIRDLGLKPLQKNETFVGAIQSYPLLIKKGVSAVSVDSGKVARRTAIGVSKESTLFIIVCNSNISLYQFSQLLEADGRFETVLNFDGGPSTGVYVHDQSNTVLIDSITPVGNILVVY